jgi:hypothetical protein
MIECLAYFIPMIVSLVLINLMVFKYQTEYVSRGDYILFTGVCLIPLVNIVMLYLVILSFWADVLTKTKIAPKLREWLDTTINPRKD